MVNPINLLEVPMDSNSTPASGDAKTTKKKHPRTKKYLATVSKIVGIFLLILACAVIGIIGGAIFGLVKTATPIDLADFNLKMTSLVYDMEGNEISQIKGDENRVWVDDKDIPQHVKDAFVALEDERFESHSGVDFQGLIAAVFEKITHPSRPMRGASTITQQVVKNVTGNDQRTPQRKIQEWWIASDLEKKMEKWQILELYMNLAVTGINTYGVEAAAKTYFNKTTSELTIAEAACIAGITNNPGIYSPVSTKGKENNRKRQLIALGNMLRLEMISQQQYDQAVSEELQFQEGTIKKTSRQSYFVDQVINDVRKDMMEQFKYTEQAANQIIFNGGIKIYTTQDTTIQKYMDEVYYDESYFKLNSSLQERPQSAMVVLDPKSGQVRALYGGALEKKADMILNRATQTKRQPGSTIKPIGIYGPAIDTKLITAGTVIDDAPSYLLPTDKTKPYPLNYDFTYGGLTAIRDAVRQSINVVAYKTLLNLGVDQSLNYLKKAGIELDKKVDGYPAPLALGALTNGTNPMQLAGAYATFVNKGMYVQPTTYSKVLDKDGKTILTKKPKSNIVYENEASAYIMTDMMTGVVNNGTAYPYGIIKNGKGEVITTAGKTGTTSDNIDKWFAGFSPYYVGVTWYGYDNKGKTPVELKGDERDMALRIWNAVMTRVHKNLSPAEFERPSGIVEKNICIESGKVPGNLCINDPRGVETIRYGELFLKGTEPKDSDVCDVHVTAKVDKDSLDSYGRPLLAGPYCPASSVVERVFVKRKEPWSALKPEDGYPADVIYEYPEGKYCTLHPGPSLSGTPTPTPAKGSPTPKASPTPRATPTPKPTAAPNQ